MAESRPSVFCGGIAVMPSLNFASFALHCTIASSRLVAGKIYTGHFEFVVLLPGGGLLGLKLSLAYEYRAQRERGSVGSDASALRPSPLPPQSAC